ncbi:hypothetical protein TrST_g2612 [Triparma strigata]|uniref:Uncharacterized protein n=2 Tax=Triparma TaxID=722752 RepID=A0A9W7AKJ8_9STRA|nr:hypothetical protein TrST_g2612 [Triparma strigata]
MEAEMEDVVKFLSDESEVPNYNEFIGNRDLGDGRTGGYDVVPLFPWYNKGRRLRGVRGKRPAKTVDRDTEEEEGIEGREPAEPSEEVPLQPVLP